MTQINLLLPDEINVDNFAGGGGASTGIEAAGLPVHIAINHDREAVAMHAANHPHTHHYCEDVWQIDPAHVTQGRRVGLAWFSPDCKHFSKAKGGKPLTKTAQVRMCGNSVCPPIAEALVRANFAAELAATRKKAA